MRAALVVLAVAVLAVAAVTAVRRALSALREIGPVLDGMPPMAAWPEAGSEDGKEAQGA